jgi:hypothetical protein
MKIEIKSFNDRVRFVPQITVIRQKKRTATAIILCEQVLLSSCQSKDFPVERLRAAIAKVRS